MLVVDIDELLFCPSAGTGITAQIKYQTNLIHTFVSSRFNDLTFSRLNYCPTNVNNEENKYNSGCINAGYANKNVTEMLSCWSRKYTVVDGGRDKSVDKGRCPFRNNHNSCYRNKRGTSNKY